ncbi:uncharacterized protein LOC126373547 isoform X11 [Pectinophora gossypiella]|uniref:uncharacterized protein LOC126373547 isoform X11 n=1 Tax=Pectinophora gossypiella TaxID=13191 RepID=UPI00214DFFB6|nr:uncharacterized protein LOC126373547 isoform X11 [Pectinophora gossypiella]
MKKRTLSKLKSLFGSKKGKRHHQESAKSSRSASPSPGREAAPAHADSFRPILRTPPPSRAGPPPSPPVPTHPVAPVSPEPSAPLPLMPCPVCSRTFVPQSLAKHVKICEKMTVKKRKTFDSSRQRREGLATPNGETGSRLTAISSNGTDLEQYLPKNFGLPENSPFLEKSPPNTAKVAPKPKASSVKNVIKGSKPMADLQRCPHCNRAFGVRAFERHVEWCADKAKILPAAPAQPPPHIADAKQRLNARTQYKAPPVRNRRSSQSREKSSNSRSASVDSSRGVSPPPPREYEDYKHGRSRASESVSSNDHEEASPHVPVIRTSRNSNNSCGDANVKARQARLARDLSSSRKPQDPTSVQQSTTDPNIKKIANKPKNKLSLRKQEQLKKLEDIASKYNERQQKRREDKAKREDERARREEAEKRKLEEIITNNAKKQNIDKNVDKSQIPVRRKMLINKNKREYQEAMDSARVEVKEMDSPKPSTSKGRHVVTKTHISAINKEKKTEDKKPRAKVTVKKESTISLDSLECTSNSARDGNHQSIGINTELLCPCVPCVIHENADQKITGRKKSARDKFDKINIQICEDNLPEPKVELLFKNLSMVSSCDIQARNYDTGPESKENVSVLTQQTSAESLSGSDKYINVKSQSGESRSDTCKIKINDCEIKENSKTSEGNFSCKTKEDAIERTRELSNEEFDEDYEHDMSGELDDSIENKYDTANDENDALPRHGSGDTYTKFTENPDDLEEFINLTDKMMSTHNFNEVIFDIDKDVEVLHTPKTNSIEAINKTISDDNLESETKVNFSATLEELKSDLQELLTGAGNDAVNEKLGIAEQNSEDVSGEDNRNISDMEHITVYELKFYERQLQVKEAIIEENISENTFVKDKSSEPVIEENNYLDDMSLEFKLPSIAENNKPTRKSACSKKKVQNIFKSNRKFKMLGEQNRNDKENQTFVKDQDSDSQSISGEAPPLKLPRIDNKSSNNIVSESLFPSSVKRSSSLLDSIQKKTVQKADSMKSRHKADQLEQDIMQSLKEFDNLYEPEKKDSNQSNKETRYSSSHNGTTKRESRVKSEKKNKKSEHVSNGNYTPNGKSADSAYSRLVSLNRISPSKLSVCNSKESNGVSPLDQIAGSDSSGCQKDDIRSVSSEEFLAMERSAELDEPLQDNVFTPSKEIENPLINEKRMSSRPSSRRSSTWRPRQELSSSESEASLARREGRESREPVPPPRLSRFCHECGSKFPVDTAKFCIECGVKRLVV